MTNSDRAEPHVDESALYPSEDGALTAGRDGPLQSSQGLSLRLPKSSSGDERHGHADLGAS